MFSHFTSETHRVVNDVYKNNTEETYSYILNYLYSKTTRVYKTIEVINEKSVRELSRNEFGISKRLLLMILDNFKFMFYTFDYVFLKLIISCLEYVNEGTFEDYYEVFDSYFGVVVGKQYKHEKYHKKLFIRLCTKDFGFDQYELVKSNLKLKELFMADYSEKFEAFNLYLYKQEPSRRWELLQLMLRNRNLVNTTSMLSSLVLSGAENSYNVVQLISEKLEGVFFVLKSCNLVLESYISTVPQKYRGEGALQRTKGATYEKILLVVSWGTDLLGMLDGYDHIEEEVVSFLSLFKACYTLKDNHVLESGTEVPSFLVSYFKLFVARSPSIVYRLLLKKIFQGDFIVSSELTVYSRTCQRLVLYIILEDGKTFHDSKLFILLAEIFNCVDCFRDTVVQLLTQFEGCVFCGNKDFNEAFGAKLRIMYFTTKHAPLREFLRKLESKSHSERTARLLDEQEKKLEGDYTQNSFDIAQDMLVYENYKKSNISKYGKSLKSSINLDGVGAKRHTRLRNAGRRK